MTTAQTNAAQIEYWNSASGENWVRFDNLLSVALAPVSRRILELAAPVPGEAAMDVGCGTGATTLMLAEMVGPGGSVLAADVSQPLLNNLKARVTAVGTENIVCQLGDVQTRSFEPASLDVIVSRFGVMFFDDPVAAFANMRRALKADGRLAFACWASADKNPWFSLPRGVAVEHLGEPEPVDPDAPGPMAFRDIARVSGILQQAGFGNVEGNEESFDLIFPASPVALAEMSVYVGPAARLAKEKQASEEALSAVKADIAEKLVALQIDGGVRFPARLNLFTATAEAA